MKILKKLLGEVADIIAGQSPPSSFYNKSGKGLPFYQGKADFGDKYPVVRNWCMGEKNKEALRNDILLSVRAPVGPVNICNNRSIIGRGLSAIRVKSGYSFEYLYFYLKNHEKNIAKMGTGSTFKAITQSQVSNMSIPFPENIDDQIRIANILDRMEQLIAKRKASIAALNELLRSVFLDMFGDPVRNEKGWNKKRLKFFGQIITGNTPPRNDAENYSSQFIEWIKTDNIVLDQTYLTTAAEFLSEKGLTKARTVKSGAILVACIAGSLDSIGRAAITDRKVAFNQQMNAIQPNEEVNSMFLYWLFKISKTYIQSNAAKGMKKIITKGDFEKITMIIPPRHIQNEFAAIAEKAENIKASYNKSLEGLENLYASLSQRAFKGELDLSKISVIHEVENTMKEIETIGSIVVELKEKQKFDNQDLIKTIGGYSDAIFNFEELWKKIEKQTNKEIPPKDEIQKQFKELLESGKVEQIFAVIRSDEHEKNNEKQIAFRGNYEN